MLVVCQVFSATGLFAHFFHWWSVERVQSVGCLKRPFCRHSWALHCRIRHASLSTAYVNTIVVLRCASNVVDSLREH